MAIKDIKVNYIVDAATKLFLTKSIAEVAVKDIAQYTGVGEATVYRYFSTKQNLVCAVATKLEKAIFDSYFNICQSGNGLGRLQAFYGQYGTIFFERRELFKFINEFDAYMVGEGKTDVSDYSDGLDSFKQLFFDVYTQGVADKSIKPLPDWEIFYYATTHALLELCKKLSAADIVRQDLAARKQEEIATLTQIIINSVKP